MCIRDRCEVRTLEDIDLVFEAGGVDRIMFDNFSPEMTRKAVEKAVSYTHLLHMNSRSSRQFSNA